MRRSRAQTPSPAASPERSPPPRRSARARPPQRPTSSPPLNPRRLPRRHHRLRLPWHRPRHHPCPSISAPASRCWSGAGHGLRRGSSLASRREGHHRHVIPASPGAGYVEQRGRQVGGVLHRAGRHAALNRRHRQLGARRSSAARHRGAPVVRESPWAGPVRCPDADSTLPSGCGRPLRPRGRRASCRRRRRRGAPRARPRPRRSFAGHRAAWHPWP